MNRIKEYIEGLGDEPQYGDFFVVSGAFGAASVTPRWARRVEQALDRRHPPKWVVFFDRAGSRLRVRARDIRAVCESTAAQRAADRQIDRARRREEQADQRMWDDES